MSTTPARSHASSIALHSPTLSAIGFSTSTCSVLLRATCTARRGIALSAGPAITTVVVGMNFVGDGLQGRAGPESRVAARVPRV
jgi:ABC-type dipeptide/oligopeptide/nickel transport system permease subunit